MLLATIIWRNLYSLLPSSLHKKLDFLSLQFLYTRNTPYADLICNPHTIFQPVELVLYLWNYTFSESVLCLRSSFTRQLIQGIMFKLIPNSGTEIFNAFSSLSQFHLVHYQPFAHFVKRSSENLTNLFNHGFSQKYARGSYNRPQPTQNLDRRISEIIFFSLETELQVHWQLFLSTHLFLEIHRNFSFSISPSIWK